MKQNNTLFDTVVARATPPGVGAIAIVRLSGPQALTICDSLAPAPKPRVPHHLQRATLYDAKHYMLDDAMVVCMHAPHSYTGEDMVELHVHGSEHIVQVVIQACEQAGARLAMPGEFTMRAFLNGRMDLSQAEAVADLIDSTSSHERLLAAKQLRGGLSDIVTGMLQQLEEIIVQLQAPLDFPEYIVDDNDHAHQHIWLGTLQAITQKIDALVQQHHIRHRHQPLVVLVGSPNAGKSSLLNTWLGEERVLVDAQAGTTRDPIEVSLHDEGMSWSVVDTAGMHTAADGLEARGIILSEKWLHRADKILWLIDPATITDTMQCPIDGITPTYAVISKADLCDVAHRQALSVIIAAFCKQHNIVFLGFISSHSSENINALRQTLYDAIQSRPRDATHVLVRARHVEAFNQAASALKRVLAYADDKHVLTQDVVCIDIEAAARYLGHIIGRDVDAAVLDRVFATFCIGK